MYTVGYQFLDLGGWKVIWARAKRSDCIVLDWASQVNICLTSNWKTLIVRFVLVVAFASENVRYARRGEIGYHQISLVLESCRVNRRLSCAERSKALEVA
eukprot:g29292.t1